MNDMISKQALMGFLREFSEPCSICEGNGCVACVMAEIEKKVQAIDAIPVRHAHWIMHPYGAECSDCKSTFRIAPMFPTVMPPKPWWRFCPSCGAQIVEEPEKKEQPCD